MDNSYIPTENDHVIRGYRMISGQGEAQSKKYFKYIGKSGKIWLIADQPNSADNIYVEGGENSRGFAGATLSFPISGSDEIVKLKGPWHSNDSAFFDDTGIDIRDKHHVMVIIGEDAKYGLNGETIVHKVLHKDEEPVLGVFHRGDVLGREWARKLGRRVFVVDETAGGSTRRFIEPDATFYWEKECTNSIDGASQAQAGIIFR